MPYATVVVRLLSGFRCVVLRCFSTQRVRYWVVIRVVPVATIGLAMIRCLQCCYLITAARWIKVKDLKNKNCLVICQHSFVQSWATVVSDPWFWLPSVEPDSVICCCSVLHVPHGFRMLRCFSAQDGCKMWLVVKLAILSSGTGLSISTRGTGCSSSFWSLMQTWAEAIDSFDLLCGHVIGWLDNYPLMSQGPAHSKSF